MEKRTVLAIVVSILSFFLILLVYTKFIGPIPFAVNNVNTNKTDLFRVTGNGEAAAVPDIAKISIGVTESSKNVTDAQTKVNSKVKNITDALIGLGVEEKNIKTTNYSVSPDYSFNRFQEITGFTVNQNLEVKSDIKEINQVIDASTANGANIAGGIEFILTDEKQLELENKARKEAVEKAKIKARSLADAAGIKLGKVVDVTESTGQEPRPVFLEAKADQAEPDQTTNITPGENKVEVTITLTFDTF